MRIPLLTMLILLGMSTLQAQDEAKKYAETITVEDLREHLVEISSDEYEGRESGYEGQRKGEKYLVDFYKENGIPPIGDTYVQEFQLNLNDPTKVNIRKGSEEFTFLDDYYYYPGTGDREITGEVYYTGYGITDKKYTDINIFNIKDKIVMVWEGEPKREDGKYKVSRSEEPSVWGRDLDMKRKTCEENGAKAMLVIKPEYGEKIGRLRMYFSRTGMSLANEQGKVDMSMPVIHMTEAMATKVLGEKAMKKAKKQLEKQDVDVIEAGEMTISFQRKMEKLTSSNVMAYIEGDEKKDELIVISAHYDHIGADEEGVYNGADDDGSGTVTCMEIAQAFAQAKAEGNGPDRSVLILNVSAEEKGLLGSQYYVENPVFPLENTMCNLNIDMIGRVDEYHPDDSEYVYLIGSDFLSHDLHDVNVRVSEKHSHLILDLKYNSVDDPNKFYYRSDHYNFAKNDIPSVFYFTGVHEDYHKTTDTVDKIMFEKLSKVAKHIFYTAWEIANQEEGLRLNDELTH